MKGMLTVAMFVVLSTSVYADESIGVFDEPDGSRCFKEITVNAPVFVYVLHKVSLEGTRGSAFRVLDTTGLISLGWMAAPGGHLISGDPYSGIAVSYGPCLSSTVYVARLGFLPRRQAQSCSEGLQVVAHPAYPEGPVAASCEPPYTHRVVSGGRFSFYPDCGFCGELATESVTWGSVKALYR